MRKRNDRYDPRSEFLRDLDRLYAAQAPRDWQRQFKPGDACEFAGRRVGGGAVQDGWTPGCIVRAHRVGFLVRGPRGLAYAPYFDVRPRGWAGASEAA